MRRGHPSRGGWRTEQPNRNFWGKIATVANFRQPQPYIRNALPPPLFPPPYRNRFVRLPVFNANNGGMPDTKASDYKERNTYYKNKYAVNTPRPYQLQHNKFVNQDDIEFHKDTHAIYFDQQNCNMQVQFGTENVNQLNELKYNEPPPLLRKIAYDYDAADCNQKNYNKPPPCVPECSTRPHSSDYYENNSFPTKDSSETFSRSVGDTVDIIRKRLLVRNENPIQPTPTTEVYNRNDFDKSKDDDYHHNTPREQNSRKKFNKQRQANVKANCSKLKDKIVHQLFKMDKGAIHKLLDNPNSSAKFEYAISSLLTESQNSFNIHTRAAAERSLNSANNDHFPYQNEDTIYEDTFLKQMQCILDPSDSVLLTDIKPIVMAEINKVLNIDEDKGIEFTDDDEIFHSKLIQSDVRDTSHKSSNVYENMLGYENDMNSNRHYHSENKPQDNFTKDVDVEEVFCAPRNYENQEENDFLLKKNFVETLRNKETKSFQIQCHPQRRNSDYNYNRRLSSSSTTAETDKDQIFPMEKSLPLFDSNTEFISDEEDPFDELDKQYHVAVDPSFIENENAIEMDKDIASPHKTPNQKDIIKLMKTQDDDHQKNNNIDSLNNATKPEPLITLQDLDIQLENFTLCDPGINYFDENSKPSLTKSNKKITSRNVDTDKNDTFIKKEININSDKSDNYKAIKTENTPEKNSNSTNSTQTLNSDRSATNRSSEQKSSRKRLTDQRESHRKEKHKKIDFNKGNEKILNKNIIINVTDCSVKPSEKCDSNTKSVFNLFFSKGDGDDTQKQSKRNEIDNISYSDKYVKRKDSAKKSENKDQIARKRRRSSSSSAYHSTQNLNADISSPDSSTPIKTDSKNKLTAINMFEEKPRKPQTHHAHRNTALIHNKGRKQGDKAVTPTDKFKSLKSCGKDTKTFSLMSTPKKNKEVQTLQSMQVTSRFCQTEIKKIFTKGTQTTPLSIEPKVKSNDVYERMKEIDLEIQLLLQEKFKLYNSIDTKDASSTSMPNFGMTVVNMAPFETNTNEIVSQDPIIENLANLPEEELEQIALEGIHDATMPEISFSNARSPKNKRNKLVRNKIKKCPNDKKSDTRVVKPIKIITRRTRNSSISLLEQIISDDRPLEDIICLEDLETKPLKMKKNKNKKIVTNDHPLEDITCLEDLETKPLKMKKNKNVKILTNDLPLDDVTCLEDLETKPLKLKKIKNEELVTDDQPLKDVVSLEHLETIPPKIKNNKNKNLKKVKKSKKKLKLSTFTVKPCSVVLMRADISKYLLQKDMPDMDKPPTTLQSLKFTPVEQVPVVNEIDFQYDMLDVSEDIVIDGNCQIDNAIEDRGVALFESEVICTDEVIDNSHTSATMSQVEVPHIAAICRTYDFTLDGESRQDVMTVTGHADAVLAVECIDNCFLAACLDGNVYYYSSDGQLQKTLRGSNLAVTCLSIVEEKYGTTVYTGSLDSRIRYYDLQTGLEKGPECNVLSPIQTMDRAWDTIFVGTRTGFVLQFECKNNMLIPVSSIKFSENSILALRALKEGPRKVLLIAARSENVTVKDAQTGLLLRTLEGPKMTVYTLLYEEGKVFCGTSSHQIQVFDYASGAHVGEHEGGKGAVCLRACGGLLFAGCYDGCVYVYRGGERTPIAQLKGPAVMLLSLAIVGNKIIAGYNDRSLYIWKTPVSVLDEMIL